jgi:hypothetical protein
VVDAGFCHGAAGVAHCFNRLFPMTGDEFLAEAAEFWLWQALAMYQPGAGFVGYTMWDGLGRRWVPKEGLLEGTAGVALALLAASIAIDPAWDRTLLLSTSPGDGA